jgi:hypothetical protein
MLGVIGLELVKPLILMLPLLFNIKLIGLRIIFCLPLIESDPTMSMLNLKSGLEILIKLS